MDYYNSVLKLRDSRETNDSNRFRYQRRLHATTELVDRLGLDAELEGHGGCVNCLEWNYKGDLLASGSDDLHIMIWDPFRKKRLQDIPTGHNGNLFSVKFLMNDTRIISGAADYHIRMHDINTKDLTLACICHGGRVKRLAVAPSEPYMFWSCAEDGVIMQYDVRTPHECSNVCNNALINLVYHLGRSAEGKCIAINPLRPELLAVGANDPYVRLYDRRMIKPTIARFPRLPNNSISFDGSTYANELVEPGEDNIPPGAVTYFVAGKLAHLPLKQEYFKKRYRTLTSTYLAFSPDGSELLANLGGEQIYLFNIVNKRKQLVLNVMDFLKPVERKSSEGDVVSKILNPTVVNEKAWSAMTLSLYELDTSPYTWSSPFEKAKYEEMRLKAYEAFVADQHTIAIGLYTKALLRFPKVASLYSNRASVFIRRGWDGDYYEAIRDCYEALTLYPNYVNAHFRLCCAFLKLNWVREGLDCLTTIRLKYPYQIRTKKFEALELDTKVACFGEIDSTDSGSEDDSGSSSGRRDSVKLPPIVISDQEKEWRASAYDYQNRYCGHLNTTTDIKEANFFGSDGQYVVAGSDDGSLFIWEKSSSTIIKVLRGDESIVNCLQPHPTTCLLASSGIDPVVRLWVPTPEDGKKEKRDVRDSEDAALANQRRMNAGPLGIMLINMGYRIPGSEETERSYPDRSNIQCRTS